MSGDLQLLRPAQVASLLNVHRCTLWRWMKAGNFPEPVKLGAKATGFRRSDVEAWLASRPTSNEGQPAT